MTAKDIVSFLNKDDDGFIKIKPDILELMLQKFAQDYRVEKLLLGSYDDTIHFFTYPKCTCGDSSNECREDCLKERGLL